MDNQPIGLVKVIRPENPRIWISRQENGKYAIVVGNLCRAIRPTLKGAVGYANNLNKAIG